MTDHDLAAGAGRSFVEALAAKRWDDLAAVVDPQVVFKGMTPGRFWDAGTAGELVEEVLQHWFEPTDAIESLEDVQVGSVADRSSLRYRLRVRNAAGVHLVEQQGYYDLGKDGRITRLHVMCAGFRLLPGQ